MKTQVKLSKKPATIPSLPFPAYFVHSELPGTILLVSRDDCDDEVTAVCVASDTSGYDVGATFCQDDDAVLDDLDTDKAMLSRITDPFTISITP